MFSSKHKTNNFCGIEKQELEDIVYNYSEKILWRVLSELRLAIVDIWTINYLALTDEMIPVIDLGISKIVKLCTTVCLPSQEK